MYGTFSRNHITCIPDAQGKSDPDTDSAPVSCSVGAVTLWFTGLPCIGKTTTARAVYQGLAAAGVRLEILDSDDIAGWFGRLVSPDARGRDILTRAMALAALSLNRFGVSCICTATTPRGKIRKTHRRMLPHYVEIWCKGSVETARKRDERGLYSMADAGLIDGFTGVDEAYESPENPDLVLDMTASPSACAETVTRFLESGGYAGLFPPTHSEEKP